MHKLNNSYKQKQGGSNEYPQSMIYFLAEIRKNNVYPLTPVFFISLYEYIRNV